EAHGGCVETGRNVKQLQIADGVCRGVELADGQIIDAARTISAVPWHQLAGLLARDVLLEHPFFAAALGLRPAPIISIHLWFDAPITDLEFAALRGTTI